MKRADIKNDINNAVHRHNVNVHLSVVTINCVIVVLSYYYGLLSVNRLTLC